PMLLFPVWFESLRELQKRGSNLLASSNSAQELFVKNFTRHAQTPGDPHFSRAQRQSFRLND
ncbi:MAG TPA: hypothetical protein VG733_07125, partial [Chthoniobacteraceae bacterium]|nr:hypothetical protein [Chthoniobacteraceae bacterium]